MDLQAAPELLSLDLLYNIASFFFPYDQSTFPRTHDGSQFPETRILQLCFELGGIIVADIRWHLPAAQPHVLSDRLKRTPMHRHTRNGQASDFYHSYVGCWREWRKRLWRFCL